jgi:hypothetical protein
MSEKEIGKKVLIKIIGLGIGVGLSLYISPYPWSFLGAALAIASGYFLCRKEYKKFLAIFSAGSIAALCAVPFIVNFLQARNMPGYEAATEQQGVLVSHAPVIGIILPLLAVLAAWGLPAGMKKACGFFLLSAAALLLILNQQIVTGFYLQPGHYHWYITKPLFGLLLGLVTYGILERIFKTKIALYGISFLCVAFLIGYASLAQIHFYKIHAPASIAAQEYAPLLAYIQAAPQPQTVLANPKISDYIPIYISSNAPADVYAPYYIAPAGYFENLSQLIAASAASSTRATSRKEALQQLHQLDITMVIEDLREKKWNDAYLGYLTHNATLGNRFEIYSVPK